MSAPPVPLSDLLTVAVQGAHGGLLRLSQQVAMPMSDQQRRKAILDYVAHAQGLLLRLLALVRWSTVQQAQEADAPRAAGQKALALLETQLSEMRRAADELFFFHEASRAWSLTLALALARTLGPDPGSYPQPALGPHPPTQALPRSCAPAYDVCGEPALNPNPHPHPNPSPSPLLS